MLDNNMATLRAALTFALPRLLRISRDENVYHLHLHLVCCQFVRL